MKNKEKCFARSLDNSQNNPMLTYGLPMSPALKVIHAPEDARAAKEAKPPSLKTATICA
jgi:hypothetical protein